jgi:hypothetical protein
MQLPSLDLSDVALAGLASWVGIRKLISFLARNKVDVAQSVADRSVADADAALYNKLKERLDAMDREVIALKADRDRMDLHLQFLRRHIWKMEKIMIQQGIEPPVFDETAFAAMGANTKE